MPDSPPAALMEPVTIRHLQEADLPRLEWSREHTRLRRMFRAAFNEMQTGLRSLWVGVAGDQVVGRLFIQWNSANLRYADGVSRAYIYALRVHRQWQGQGIGTRLIAAAEDELRARGFTVATLAVGQTNAAAFRLYQRLGYQVIAEDPGVWYYTDELGNIRREEELSWLMEKRLPG
jgi:ribosomal protein S18 acetylase RimI-like enzyme